MPRLIWLIRRWRLVAAHLRRRIRANEPDAWLDAVRLRIYAFLISRYGEAPPNAGLAPHPAPYAPPSNAPRLSPITEPIQPQNRPPKPTAAMAPLLRDIRAQNEAQQRHLRWRFWP